MRSKRDLTLDIPAGVADGMRLHLSGQGEVGFAGGPAGDIYLEVSVTFYIGFESHSRSAFWCGCFRLKALKNTIDKQNS